MSHLMDYAKRELARIEHDEEGIQSSMDKCVLDLLEKLSEQGHSGFSASYCLAVFNRLARYKPLTPLTGEDDEWVDLGRGLLQNKRCYSVFKDLGDGRSYDNNGRAFSDDGGKTWYVSRDSRVYIDFPYDVPDKPEKVYLDKDGEKNDSN